MASAQLYLPVNLACQAIKFSYDDDLSAGKSGFVMVNQVFKGTILLLAMGALFAPLTLQAQTRAQVYSWTDGNGVKHYGDSNSAPISAKKIAVRAASVPTSDTASAAAAPDSGKSKDAAEGSDQAVSQNEAQACRVAQNNRKLLADPKQNVLSEDGKGVLDAAARAQRLALADKRVEAYCQVLGSDAGNDE